MLKAASPLPSLDETPVAASSAGGEPSLLELLQQEVATLRQERDSLRQEKRSDKLEIERLKLLLDKFKHMLFGRKSEKLLRQIEQLELELEEAYITQGEREERVQLDLAPAEVTAKRDRQPLPDHLPRETQEHLPKDGACPDCGGGWQRLGEDVSEVLELVPARFRVVRHVRPRMACSCCDRMAQAPAPSRPISRSYAGPGLLAHVMTSKYLDHLPLYRQAQIYAREGVPLSESTLGVWVGGVHELLRPLTDALQRYVFSAEKMHTDDTPIAVLAPGTGNTRQGASWKQDAGPMRGVNSTTSMLSGLRPLRLMRSKPSLNSIASKRISAQDHRTKDGRFARRGPHPSRRLYMPG